LIAPKALMDSSSRPEGAFVLLLMQALLWTIAGISALPFAIAGEVFMLGLGLASLLLALATCLLAIGILLARPIMEAPAVSQFAKTGNGPVFAGSLFPFLFITIACGALSVPRKKAGSPEVAARRRARRCFSRLAIGRQYMCGRNPPTNKALRLMTR